MALQINRTLTTQNGFSVPTGCYVWLRETRGELARNGFGYAVKVELFFYKDKASFDASLKRFNPVEVPDDLNVMYQEFTPSNYASLTSMQVHNFVKAALENVLGASTITVVQ